MDKTADIPLHERVSLFGRNALPGQPAGMHMGTYYLVQDLWKEVEHQRSVVESEREARQKLDGALRQKDAAMGVLFERLNKAGVDTSDLIP